MNTNTDPELLAPVWSSHCAPATTVLPSLLTPTEIPKKSFAEVSVPVSLTLVGAVELPHPSDGLVITFIAPALLPRPESLQSATTIVLSSSLAATLPP